MSSVDEYWDKMLTQALIYQQYFYEMLPTWTVYKSTDIEYLRQNIGYALFGSPLFKKDTNSKDILNYNTDNVTDNKVITEVIDYGPKANEIINLIADKICDHGRNPGNGHIISGIIYLIIIENKPTATCDIKDAKHVALPIFKIQKYNDDTNVSKEKSNDRNIYTTWYIDTKGRVYKSWIDFMTTNELPQCTVIYPKDGYYQPDIRFDVTPKRSIVWVVAQDSYACCQRAKTYSKINYTMNTLGAGAAIGLGVASFLTPVGPGLAAAGLVVSSLSGVWTIGQCSAELYDRSIHEESINPFTDRNAMSCWLGITGCTVGIAFNGSSIYLKNAAAMGKEVSAFAKTAYNVTLVGSVSINLIGLCFQGVNIYEKYQETGNVDMRDILYFGTHLLFFANSVVDIKFANDVIKATQGRVIKEYEANLRENNMRKYYDSVKAKAAETYKNDQIAQNTDIIRYINNFDRTNVSDILPFNNNVQSSILTFHEYKVKVNGITLIDPVLFVADLVKSFISQTTETWKDGSNSTSTNQNHPLMKVLEKLLNDLYLSKNCPSNEQLLLIPDFKVLINDMKKIKGSEDILPFIFNTALILVKAENKYAYLVKACCFLWDYLKEHCLKAARCYDKDGPNALIQNMRKICVAILDAVDSMIYRFLNALYQYIDLSMKQTQNCYSS